MKTILAAATKYATNHLIAHIPSHTLRMAWYRRVPGWRIGPRVTYKRQEELGISKDTIHSTDTGFGVNRQQWTNAMLQVVYKSAGA